MDHPYSHPDFLIPTISIFRSACTVWVLIPLVLNLLLLRLIRQSLAFALLLNFAPLLLGREPNLESRQFLCFLFDLLSARSVGLPPIILRV